MRDIIYRGKTKDGEWEYGGVVIYEKDAFIITKEDFSWSIMGDRGDYDGCITPVLPETVGQYTGLTDRNGKKIFEGDIVKNEFGEIDKVAFLFGRFVPFNRYPEYRCFFCERCEVIGNIHDNPELLEVK